MTAKLTRPDSTEWMRLAACRNDDVNPEIFFPTQDNGPSLSKARHVCASCWVKADCPAYALAIEGGQSESTRAGHTIACVAERIGRSWNTCRLLIQESGTPFRKRGTRCTATH